MMTMTSETRAHRRSVSYGVTLTFETLAATAEPATRMRAEEQTLLRVIDGLVLLAIDGDERLLAPGEEAIVPARAPHRLASVAGEARLVMDFRPAR
jgi:mannose-6-phosphate isomerase-like protein (cupin superfamily)